MSGSYRGFIILMILFSLLGLTALGFGSISMLIALMVVFLEFFQPAEKFSPIYSKSLKQYCLGFWGRVK